MSFKENDDATLQAWERDRVPVLDVNAALTADDIHAPRDVRVAIWLDVSKRPDLIALATAHGADEGTCRVQWGFTLNPDRTVDVLLRFEFTEPVPANLTVGFNLPDQARDIERVVLGRGELALVFVQRDDQDSLNVSLNAASMNKLANTVATLMVAMRAARAIFGDAPGAQRRTPRGRARRGGGGKGRAGD